MADEVLYAGGELDSIIVVGGAPSESAAAVFDATYARRAIFCTDANDIFRIPFLKSDSTITSVVTGETLWAHFEVYYGAGDSSQIFKVVDGSGFPWFAIQGGGSNGNIRPAYNSGTGASPTWTTLGPGNYFTNSSVRIGFDVKITLGSPHSYEVYINNVMQFSGTFTQASFTSANYCQFQAFANAADCYWSQMLATRNIGTVSAKVHTRVATGAGTTNAWTGAYTDINEATTSDATVLTSGTANQVYTFAMADSAIPSGFSIRSVFTWARAKNNGAAPNNFQHAIRRSGTDYFSPNVAGINSGYYPVGAQWATDPSGGNWGAAGWDAAEVGGKSIT